MIALELARELKVAQLPWRPRRGDVVMDRLNVTFLVLRDGMDVDGAVVIDTAQGVERRPFLGLTWVPRVDQMVELLAQHGAFTMTARPAGEGRRDSVWRVTLRPQGEEEERHFEATVAGDAAGKALHYLLSAGGWRPRTRRSGGGADVSLRST